ncbi:energy-coupling factor ABC transporter permease [Pseudomonas syringae]|uniref:energy-coupling factor ABC transporter permease n=1 Tax=Pseudomonas syringae TaxID=317 RepID=UPI00215AEF3E|nr:energy-coupling factor ABC transporter permease [Pseudomonas syringae]MCR8718350.1 energy-coupling factor ABC transporter permease [Pseudomonas syringae]
MHIEPGLVTGAKLILGFATASAVLLLSAKMFVHDLKKDGGLVRTFIRSFIATAAVFCFFELLPHPAVGVSEVHLILGSTLFLLLGAGPAAFGLAMGLLLQGLFFAPFDLPQYGMNVTTLLVPLLVVSKLSHRIIPKSIAYVDIRYSQALALSLSFQGGIVAWVAFWSIYAEGLTWQSIGAISSFGAAYMSVILVEPLIDLAVLFIAKQNVSGGVHSLLSCRVYVSNKP